MIPERPALVSSRPLAHCPCIVQQYTRSSPCGPNTRAVGLIGYPRGPLSWPPLWGAREKDPFRALETFPPDRPFRAARAARKAMPKTGLLQSVAESFSSDDRRLRQSVHRGPGSRVPDPGPEGARLREDLHRPLPEPRQAPATACCGLRLPAQGRPARGMAPRPPGAQRAPTSSSS